VSDAACVSTGIAAAMLEFAGDRDTAIQEFASQRTRGLLRIGDQDQYRLQGGFGELHICVREVSWNTYVERHGDYHGRFRHICSGCAKLEHRPLTLAAQNSYVSIRSENGQELEICDFCSELRS
jgi:hypothetical protein